jgi:hypothetical protein
VSPSHTLLAIASLVLASKLKPAAKLVISKTSHYQRELLRTPGDHIYD